MICRRTQSRVHGYRRGYTLIEMMFAVGIGAIILAAIASIGMFTARSFEALGNYSDMDRESRHALDTLGRDIRQATGLSACATNQIILTNATSTLTYSWDAASGIVTRTYVDVNGQVVRNLLRQCDYLEFRIYQRNPGNNFTFNATGNPAQAKFIEMTWRCSRAIYGQPVNSESLQTAKFAIRN